MIKYISRPNMHTHSFYKDLVEHNMGAVTMYMNSKLMILLIASCALSFGVAFWAFASGAGLLVAFLVYSLGGSALMMTLTAISYMASNDEDENEASRLDVFRAKMTAGEAEADLQKSTLAFG